MTDLSKYHTRQLLNALQEFRVYKTATQMYDYYEEEGFDVYSPFYTHERKDGELIVFLQYPDVDPVTEAELKAELATREHIPNKQEAKEIRRQKAKQQRNR